MSKLLNTSLLVIAIVFLALAVWTVLPASTSTVSDLGYYSACPFAPWSTLAMLIVASSAVVLRQYVRTRPY